MRILLGVSGGIAAYKALEFARLAVKADHAVRVVQTPSSLRFVGRSSFAAITGAPVLVSEFEDDPLRGAWPGEGAGSRVPISHLALVERAEIMVVAPATANLISRLAAGSADDLVATAALAASCPVVVAPAMNGAMWSNEATRRNVAVLRDRGLVVIDPATGRLASHGEEGTGRLVEPDVLLAAVEELGPGAAGVAPSGGLEGRRVLVTAGGTREPIDEVRYIGNRSSGRMGIALAREAIARGAEVTLIAANLQVPAPEGCNLVEVEEASELGDALELRFPQCEILLMAAAVADFRPASRLQGKIDKSQGIESIELEPVPDLVASAASVRRAGQLIVAFAAEHGQAIERAMGKLEAKGVDMIVLNDISDPGIGFDSDMNEVVILAREGKLDVPRAGKDEIASAILDACADRLPAAEPSGQARSASPEAAS